ncbi:iron ABC transporter ATP-binding protein, partial [Neisseria meningitidis]
VFCQRTDYVLLDEPRNNLEMYHARWLMQILQKHTRKHNRATVAVLPDITQAAAYADYVVAMKNAQVAKQGKPTDIFTAENIKT